MNEQDSIEAETREKMNRMVHRMMLSMLLARSTLGSDNQREEIDRMMDVFSGVIRNELVKVAARTQLDMRIRNLMVEAVADETAQIRLVAQNIADGMREPDND